MSQAIGLQHLTLNTPRCETNLRDKIPLVHEIYISAESLVERLLEISKQDVVCLLDSCGVSHLDSHLLIAGIQPKQVTEISNTDADKALETFESLLTISPFAAIFTLSYDFGKKLQLKGGFDSTLTGEPDVFIAQFDCLVIHDYRTARTFLTGHSSRFPSIENLITGARCERLADNSSPTISISSNFSKSDYIKTIEQVQDRIREGDTYQTNLTQQLSAGLPPDFSAQVVFKRLRDRNPAPFSAFISRPDSIVISASPERFIEVFADDNGQRIIRTSPIKGTRPRGKTDIEDEQLRHELAASPKDAAENTMIVDLMRNDLGRICEFGSVEVEKMLELHQFPTLFHLISTVRGILWRDSGISEILRAVFPCGSITGAPKINTMRIIDELEPSPRGLSMGAIGIYFPEPESASRDFMPSEISGEQRPILDLSVAIRTAVIQNRHISFNVGGGIVIDSDPETEYAETLTKASALLDSLNAAFVPD